MKLRNLFFIVLLTSFAQARNAKVIQNGTLIQMDSAQCGSDQASSKSLTGEILGTDSGHKRTRELLCPEYVLQSDQNTYRIRPKDEKHPALLPVGAQAQFWTDKDQIKLRVPELGNKERGYVVVSITPRTSGEANATLTPKGIKTGN